MRPLFYSSLKKDRLGAETDEGGSEKQFFGLTIKKVFIMSKYSVTNFSPRPSVLFTPGNKLEVNRE